MMDQATDAKAKCAHPTATEQTGGTITQTKPNARNEQQPNTPEAGQTHQGKEVQQRVAKPVSPQQQPTGWWEHSRATRRGCISTSGIRTMRSPRRELAQCATHWPARGTEVRRGLTKELTRCRTQPNTCVALMKLTLNHCTLAPGNSPAHWNQSNKNGEPSCRDLEHWQQTQPPAGCGT